MTLIYLPKAGDRVTCTSGHHILDVVDECEAGVIHSRCFRFPNGEKVTPQSEIIGICEQCGSRWAKHEPVTPTGIALHIEGHGWTSDWAADLDG